MKYIDLPIPELYDLRGDPRRAAQSGGRAAAGGRAIASAAAVVRERRRRRADETAEVGSGCARSATSRRVRAAAAGATPKRDDPKRLIGVETSCRRSSACTWPGDRGGARARPRARGTSVPTCASRCCSSRSSSARRATCAAAIAALRRALAIDPGDAESASLLGAYLTAANRPREAVDAASAVCRASRRRRAGARRRSRWRRRERPARRGASRRSTRARARIRRTRCCW